VRPTAIVLALLLLLLGPPAFVLFTLNKINRHPPQLEVNPNQETLDTDGYEDLFDQADDDIRANLANELWSHPDVYNVLLAGVDHGEDEAVMFDHQYYPRSDAMILVSANKQTRQVTLVSISRATYAALPGHANGRLNLSHAYGGPEYMVQCIEANYRVRIDRYMTVDFMGFQKLISIIGGVSVTLDAAEYEAMGASFATFTDGPGVYDLNGPEALAYARLRYIDSDRARTLRQRTLLRQIAAKARKLKFEQVRSSVDAILPLVTTNMGNFELLGLAQYAGYGFKDAIIPQNPMGLTLRDGKEVILLNWNDVRIGIHDLLYPGLLPEVG
jgi:LCP family protein required for cell wall assembly